MNKLQEKQYYEILDIAFYYGFMVISDEYKDNKAHMEFKCPQGHLRITSSNNYRKWPYSCYECSRLMHGVNLKIDHPELINEWHPSNKLMENYSSGSTKKVWWICSKNPCGCHIWEATIIDRTRKHNELSRHKRTGCPYCSNKKLCAHNNLSTTHPQYVREWHFKNNPIETYSFGSVKKVWWICLKNPCGCHVWQASPSERVRKYNKGCPFCSQHKLCAHNNLTISNPHLINEWHPDNGSMEKYSIGSHMKVKWICSKNPRHMWYAQIKNRTRKVNPSGCPICCKIGHSKEAHAWLQTIENEQKIKLQHALSSGGEYKIQLTHGKFYKVDGYHAPTRTIYEYHGDYWHGNPSVYNPDNTNDVNGKTFGDLYHSTIKREEHIKSMGYNLVVKWQTPIKCIEINYVI